MTAIAERPAELPDVQEPPVGGDRFVARASLTVGLLLVAVQALAGEVIPPLAAFAVLYLGFAAAAARRRSRWALIGVTIVTLLHVLGSLPFSAANLSHPESPGSFLAEAFVMIAALATMIGAIGGLRGARPGTRRPIALGAVGLACVAMLVSAVAASSVASEARQPGDVAVEAAAVAFPERVEVPAGGAVLWIENQDPFHHTLVIEGTEVHQTLPASKAVRTPVDLAPGTYRFFCDVPGHERMEGELVAF